MPMANYPQGFGGGVQIQGLPVLNSYSTSAGTQNTYNAGVWCVDSNTGVNGNKGDTWYLPVATLARAVALAKAYDIIQLKSGHAESISTSTALAISTKGLQIIGYGVGGTRPTLTLDTANTATITVSADSVSFTNVVFVANFLAVAALFTLTTAKGFTLNACEVYDTDATHNFVNVISTSATSNANDGLTVQDCNIFLKATSGATKFIGVLGTHDRFKIQRNYYATPTTGTGAVFPITAGKVLTNAVIYKNKFNLVNATGTATAYLITTNGSTNSGLISENYDWSAPTTPLLVTASSGFVFDGNLHSNTADLQGYLVPAADS